MRQLAGLLTTVIAIVRAALLRLRADAWLACCALAALTLATAAAVCVPSYAGATTLRLLREEITQQEQRERRSPFALLFRYLANRGGPLEWERVAAVDAYLTGPGIAALDLPIENLVRHVRTDRLRVFRSGTAEQSQLAEANLGVLTGLDDRIRIIDGAAPQPRPNGTIEVMVARGFADRTGLNVDEELTLTTRGSRPSTLAVRISAIWEPLNAADPAWYARPDSLDEVLLTDEATFTTSVADALTGEVNQILWYARLDADGLTVPRAVPLLSRIDAIQANVVASIGGVRLEQGPADLLARYTRESGALTLQLFAYSVPTAVLTIYFIALIAGLMTERRSAEIALLKTRGVRDSRILAIAMLEWLLLTIPALGLGALLGLAAAAAMTRIGSFLTFSAAIVPAEVALTGDAIRSGVAAVVIAALAALLPSIAATRRTLADEQRSASRITRAPLWQRAYLDVLLLAVAVYGVSQLQQTGGAGGIDPFANPLPVLVPALLCFALGLLVVRVTPVLLGILVRLAARPAWVVPLVALRTLARRPQIYRGPLLLLTVTLSLAIFSATIASAAEISLRSATTYQIGADSQLIEAPRRAATRQPGAGQPAPATDQPRYLFVPVSEHLAVPGIRAATRVGSFSATPASGTRRTIQLVGIDRTDFPQAVQRFDPAWAGGAPLGALMNTLARRADGALVTRDAAADLQIGDPLPLVVPVTDGQREVVLRVAGFIEYWPGFYPQDGPIIVANLDYLFDNFGAAEPYDVWISRAPDADIDVLVAEVRALGIVVADARDAQRLIARAQSRPARQGLFGLLTLGFVTSGALTLIGFAVVGAFYARRRTIELGMLRALGLAGVRVLALPAIEQAVIVVLGLAAGSGIGWLVATQVAPLLQVGAGPYPGTPPERIPPAWDLVLPMYGVFALALCATLVMIVFAVARTRAADAIKLGDAN